MVTRRDWWIGVWVIVLALLAHAIIPQYLPRYEYQYLREAAGVRIDRWVGRAEFVFLDERD